MTVIFFYLLVALAGLGGYAVLVRLGLEDFEAWAGGRMTGLVLAAVPAWWLGVIGLSFWRSAAALLLVAIAVAGGIVAWNRRERWRELATSELVFSAGMFAVLFIRLDHPHIAGQEKPMDVGIFATLLKTDGFPPPDMWLSGWDLPYYYWGALVWTAPINTSGLALEYAYNLVVALIGGLVFVTLWALGRRLTGGTHVAGAIAAFLGLLAGTPDGLRQLLQGTPLGGLDIWKSSRQHGDVITEFPLFTAWLGDLHPHLLSMPIAALALLMAWKIGREGPRLGSTTLLAVLFGISWAANPWAMPPTLAGIALLILTSSGSWQWPTTAGRSRWLAIVAVVVGGWLTTAPFHLTFQPFFRGIGRVFAWTSPSTLILYGGHLVVPALAMAVVLARQRLGGNPARRRALLLSAAAAVVILASATGKPTAVALAAGLALLGLWTLGREPREERPAVALAALGLFLFLVPELIYVADGYGDRLHRMNTVFKSYIQAWMVLSVAMPALIGSLARSKVARRVLIAAVLLPTLPHLLWALSSQFYGRPMGLDGLAWMAPGDRAIVRHLRMQPAGTSLIEAVGGAYSEYGRLSANSGVPAFLGWANHELVWRGHEITDETNRRASLVKRLYSCGSSDQVRALVAEAGVDLVAIGKLERDDFRPVTLAAVRAAGEVELDEDDGVLIRFPRTEAGESPEE
jgi:YYY domain-containing protein